LVLVFFENARQRLVSSVKKEACTSKRSLLSQQPGSYASPYM